MLTETLRDKHGGLRDRKKRATRARILESAAELFVERGVDGATMAAIAERAGISRPSVFNYFPTKDALLIALVHGINDRTREVLAATEPDADTDAATALTDYFRVYAEMSFERLDKATWRHVEATYVRAPGTDFVRAYQELVERMRGDLLAFMRKIQPQGPLAQALSSAAFSDMVFDFWSARFVDLIRSETMGIDDHLAGLHRDFSDVLRLMSRSNANGPS